MLVFAMRVAAIQSNVVFNDPEANADRAIDELRRLARDAVQLAVLPECFLTGYCVDSDDEARDIAIPRDHPALRRVEAAAGETGVFAVLGFAERGGDKLYNTVALFEPCAKPRYYRKTHLPFLGYDRFSTPGDELPLFETGLGTIGVQICFDQRLPEPTRALALAGAELILIPTNWPVGAENSADIMCIARAAENRVWVVTADRVGVENGFTFLGRSKIIAPSGAVVAAAGADEEVLVADIDLAEARTKRTVNVPGKYEMETFATRRPELYAQVVRRAD